MKAKSATHRFDQTQVVTFRETKDFLGQPVITVRHQDGSKTTMSVTRFVELYEVQK